MEAGKVCLQHRDVHKMDKRLRDRSVGGTGPCAGNDEEELAEVLGKAPCFMGL